MKRMSRLLTIMLTVIVFAACGQNQETSETGRSNAGTQHPPAGADGAEAALVWTAPDGWVEEPPESAIRMAQYRLPRIEGDIEDAVAAVFHFRGAGGTVDANLNRWYGQFVQPDGRPSVEAAKVEKTEHNGLKQTTVDLSGTFRQSTTPMGPVSAEKPKYRMLAGVIETPSGPWFIKITGPEKTVAHWQESFYDFMASVEPAP